MKSTLIIRIGVIALFFIGLSSCKKDLSELNVNPNEPVSTDPNYLFRYAQKQGISSYNSNVNLEQWGLMNWMMYFASRGGVEPGKEYVVPTGKDAFWTEQYADALNNTNEVLLITAKDGSQSNMYAAAQIWRVWLFHRLTDLWGDIPYSEALQGLTNLNYAPKYDLQSDIYLSMLNDLKSAEANLTAGKTFFDPSADIVGKGDINCWKRFANSLRLRLAVRIKNKLPSRYASEMADLATKNLISSNAESIVFTYNSEKKNPIFEANVTGQAIIQNNPSKFLVDVLVNTNDPRKKLLLEKCPMSILPWIPPYKGVPNLAYYNDAIWSTYNSDNNWGDISRLGKWFLRNQTPGVIISYSEVCLLKAEATLDGNWSGTAQQHFEDGIKANIHFFEDFKYSDTASYLISDAEINTYISALPTIDLEQIITQKWISFAFSNGYEAYCDYRRTGFPKLKKHDGTYVNFNSVPKRMIYPNFETTLNRTNYLEAIARQGTDNEFTKIWWMN